MADSTPTTRRRFVHTTAALAAVVLALPSMVAQVAEPDPSPDPRNGFLDNAAIHARGEHAIKAMRYYHVADGWHDNFDNAGADRAIAFLRDGLANEPEGEMSSECWWTIKWFHHHGVSLDWLLCGDFDPLLVGCIAGSPAAAGIKNTAEAA